MFTLEQSDKSLAGAAGSVMNMGKPALALLGGFSANMVYKVLQRIVDTIESLFKGDQQAVLEAQRAAELAQLGRAEDDLRGDMAQRLSEVEKAFDADPDAARAQLKAQIDELLAGRQ